MNTQSFNQNGVILHEDALRVVIATGLERASANDKTGDMVQVWILHRTISPLAAIRTGRDSAICGTCPHRGKRKLTGASYSVLGRRCYVQVDKAPSGIWKAYRRNRYRRIEASEYTALFSGRLVRFGAYGDPVFIPLDIVQAITSVCKDWTGYTHQWKDAQYQAYSAFVMASSDSDLDSALAVSSGWRYFRVRAAHDMTVSPGEIRCPAALESGKRTTCEKCKLCNGAKYANDARKNITIIDHSRIAKSQPLINIQ